MTQADLKELITFAKVMKLEKETLQEVLDQKDFADQYGFDAELASHESYTM